MELDILAYLQLLDPEVSYTLQPITSGVVNVTVHIVKSSEDVHRGKFPGHASYILKHAPPYIAKLGKDAPFSPFRQTIEARALGLFSRTSPSGLAQIAEDTEISIPSLVHHDPAQHVLIMTDLGPHPDLTHYFIALGGYHPKLEPEGYGLSLFDGQTLRPEYAAFFRRVGAQVGAFFARLHAHETRERIADHAAFDNPDARATVIDHAVKPAIDHIAEHLGPAREAEAAALGDVVLAHARAELPEAEKCFTLGDCWPSAILLQAPSASLQQPLVGVIDWEFAHFGRGVDGDMAQLMAHLDMLRIAAAQHPRFRTHLEALNVLITALVTAYTPQPSSRPLPGSGQATKMRAALIAMGTEMINCARWKKWTCIDPACIQDGGSHAAPDKCTLVRKLLDEGICLIRLAKANDEAFCSSENWREVEAQAKTPSRRKGKWLVDLF